GSIVHLAETVPVAPAHLDWAKPDFSQNDFTVSSTAPVAVTLTNEASLARGSFSAAKVLAGDAAAEVPTDAVFTLAYEYAAGDGFAAGSGMLLLPADGTVVTSPSLPVGAVVELSELA